MKIKPERLARMSDAKRTAIMDRSMEDISSVYDHVRNIVEDVRRRGDASVLDELRRFQTDIGASDLEVSQEETEAAYRQVDTKVVEALKTAARHITRFHQAQLEREMWSIEVSEGVLAGRITRPIDRVGCYIPGGTAAYPSSALMMVLPAKVAGVRHTVAATPPGEDMAANPATVVAADIAGCDRLFKVGGPWAIAALAFGTDTIPEVDKIVGPGNKYVTAAKMLVYGRVGIDSPAGPSEALILADESADPRLIALDFLSQLEHDPDSAAVLVTPSKQLAESVCERIERELDSASRRDVIESALTRHAHVLIAEHMEEALQFTNAFAAEHLQILTEYPLMILNRIRHAGSIFLGPYAPVPVGDYASGTNHVLPTARCARMFSGLSVDTFMKRPTFQYLSKQGLAGLREVVTTLAEAEGLSMHAKSVEARFH